MGKNFFEKIANWINGSPDVANTNEVKEERSKTPKTINKNDAKHKTKKKVSDKKGATPITAGATSDNKKSGKTTKQNTSIGKNNTSKPVEEINNTDKNVTKNVPGRNAIEKKDNLINAVIASLNSNYRGEQYSMADKALYIFILDGIFYDSIKDSDFKSELSLAISDELGLVFNSIEIKKGPLPSNEDATELFSKVHIGVKSIQKVKAIRRAIISPVANNGSTIEPEYILDSEEIATLSNCRYNIGAGENPIMADNSHRKNDIAIDDDPNASEFEKNKYVSRAHANITFSEDYGFILHVEFGGTRVAQKRTHIQRGCEKIELDNTLIPVPLKDGDYIVLSKYVHLLFKEA